MVIDDICWPEDGNPDQIELFLAKLDRLIGHFPWLHFLPDNAFATRYDDELLDRFGEPDTAPDVRLFNEYWTIPYAEREAAFTVFFRFISAELVVVAADRRLDSAAITQAVNAREKQPWFAALYFDSGDLMENGTVL